MSTIGINLEKEITTASYFDNSCVVPQIIATVNGYDTLSEKNMLDIFTEIKKRTGADKATITVPAYFNFLQRDKLKEIALKSGIETRRLICKSSAAALGYEFSRNSEQRKEDKYIVCCTVDDNIIEIGIVAIGDGVVEVKTIDWGNYTYNAPSDSFNELFKRTIAKVALKIDDIDEIILYGNLSSYNIAEFLPDDIKKKKIINNKELATFGIAIQSAILNGHIKDVLLLEILSSSISAEFCGNVLEITRCGTSIPTRSSVKYSINKNNKLSENIKIYEGDNKIMKQNLLIGELSVKDILPSSWQELEIEITLDIDANRIIHVSAKNTKIKKECKVRI